jgi:hypothetical protein
LFATDQDRTARSVEVEQCPVCRPREGLIHHLPKVGFIHFSALNSPQDSLTHERKLSSLVGFALLVCLAARLVGSFSCFFQGVQLLLRRS